MREAQSLIRTSDMLATAFGPVIMAALADARDPAGRDPYAA